MAVLVLLAVTGIIGLIILAAILFHDYKQKNVELL